MTSISDVEIKALEQRIRAKKTRRSDWQLHRQVIDQITNDTRTRAGKKS